MFEPEKYPKIIYRLSWVCCEKVSKEDMKQEISNIVDNYRTSGWKYQRDKKSKYTSESKASMVRKLERICELLKHSMLYKYSEEDTRQIFFDSLEYVKASIMLLGESTPHYFQQLIDFMDDSVNPFNEPIGEMLEFFSKFERQYKKVLENEEDQYLRAYISLLAKQSPLLTINTENDSKELFLAFVLGFYEAFAKSVYAQAIYRIGLNQIIKERKRIKKIMQIQKRGGVNIDEYSNHDRALSQYASYCKEVGDIRKIKSYYFDVFFEHFNDEFGIVANFLAFPYKGTKDEYGDYWNDEEGHERQSLLNKKSLHKEIPDPPIHIPMPKEIQEFIRYKIRDTHYQNIITFF